jgi:hypothetical protein
MNLFCVCSALKILVEGMEERVWVLQQGGGGGGGGGGLGMLYEALATLCRMHHEATACNVAGELVDLLNLTTAVLRVARNIANGASGDKKGMRHATNIASPSGLHNGAVPNCSLSNC